MLALKSASRPSVPVVTTAGTSELRISDLAARGGVPATTVRYYERLGLLSPAPRTTDNQRRYDDSALGELRFVRHAKHLGLSLTEIRELVTIRDAGRCASVQSRLASLVAERRTALTGRLRELRELDTELRLTAATLASTPADGPCTDDCGCAADPTAAADPPASVEPYPTTAVPLACTLEPSQLPQRMAEWAEIAGQAVRREAGDTEVRLAFPRHAGLAARVADLCVREQHCCPIFEFSLQIRPTELVLTVSGPSPADVLALLPAPRG